MTRDEVWEKVGSDRQLASVLTTIEECIGGAFITNRQRLMLAQEIVIKYLPSREINEIRAECTKGSGVAICAQG